MTDNGARALAERLAAIWPTSTWGTGSAPPSPTDHSYEVPDRFIVGPPDRLAAAILANGAVFLPDAAELDRLRRLPALVSEYLAADAAMPEFADAQRMPAEEWDRLNRRWAAADVALRAALQPEGSAGTARVGMIEADKRHQERARIAATVRAAEGSAGTRDWLAAHPEIDAALDRSLDEAEVEYAARRATEGSARDGG